MSSLAITTDSNVPDLSVFLDENSQYAQMLTTFQALCRNQASHLDFFLYTWFLVQCWNTFKNPRKGKSINVKGVCCSTLTDFIKVFKLDLKQEFAFYVHRAIRLLCLVGELYSHAGINFTYVRFLPPYSCVPKFNSSSVNFIERQSSQFAYHKCMYVCMYVTA